MSIWKLISSILCCYRDPAKIRLWQSWHLGIVYANCDSHEKEHQRSWTKIAPPYERQTWLQPHHVVRIYGIKGPWPRRLGLVSLLRPLLQPPITHCQISEWFVERNTLHKDTMVSPWCPLVYVLTKGFHFVMSTALQIFVFTLSERDSGSDFWFLAWDWCVLQSINCVKDMFVWSIFKELF